MQSDGWQLGCVYYWNDDGNEVYLGYNVSLARVNTVNDIVDGFAAPNATVSLTLKRGGSAIATASALSDMGGFFSAFFTDAVGGLADIRVGDVVEMTASPTASMSVERLTANINTTNDVVSGTGPANAALLIKAFAWTGSGWASVSKTAYTSASGSFSASFSSELDLTDVSYVYVRYSDANGNQTGYTTTPPHSPLEDMTRQDILGQGAAVEQSAFGAANSGDLTPPVTYKGGGGRLVFASRNGSLVVTRPDGSVDVGGTMFVVDKAPIGVWKVQVRVWGSEGSQYAIAIGEAVTANRIYLPLTLKAP